MNKLQPRRESKFCYCQVSWCTNICRILWNDRHMSWNFLLGFLCYLHKVCCLLLHLLFHFLAKWIEKMCRTRKYPYPPPPSPRRARVILRVVGLQKEAISEGVRGCLQRFFPGGLSKIGELVINNSLSVEQAVSYFTVTGVALIIFHLQSAKCFFHGWRDSFL